MFGSLEINKHQPFLYFSLDFVQILTGTPLNSPFKIACVSAFYLHTFSRKNQ